MQLSSIMNSATVEPRWCPCQGTGAEELVLATVIVKFLVIQEFSILYT